MYTAIWLCVATFYGQACLSVIYHYYHCYIIIITIIIVSNASAWISIWLFPRFEFSRITSVVDTNKRYILKPDTEGMYRSFLDYGYAAYTTLPGLSVYTTLPGLSAYTTLPGLSVYTTLPGPSIDQWAKIIHRKLIGLQYEVLSVLLVHWVAVDVGVIIVVISSWCSKQWLSVCLCTVLPFVTCIYI